MIKNVILLTLLTTVFYNTQTMEKKKEEKENKQPQQQTIYLFGDEPETQTQEYQIAKNGINGLLLLKTETSEHALESIKLKYLKPHQELQPNIHALLEEHGLLVNNAITEEMYTAIKQYKKTTAYFKQVTESQQERLNQHLSNLPAAKKAKVLENTKQQILAFKKKLDKKKEKSKDS